MNSQIVAVTSLGMTIAVVIIVATTLTFASFSIAFGATTSSANITIGASSKTTDAFSPNPLNVKVGDTVNWTNNDLQPHTVTSGTSATPDWRFDSSPGLKTLLTSKNTFSHTFNQTGTFPYFCQLHPNMLGTVNVSSSGNGGANTPEFPVITILILGGAIASIIAYSRFARNSGVGFSRV